MDGCGLGFTLGPGGVNRGFAGLVMPPGVARPATVLLSLTSGGGAAFRRVAAATAAASDLGYCYVSWSCCFPRVRLESKMTMSYQEQQLLQAATGRAAILDLTARHNRAYSDGDRDGWIATFRHSGASYTRDGESFTDLRAAFDGGDGQRLVSLDHEVQVGGVNAVQRCVAVLFAALHGDTNLRATGIFRDKLVYERGGWYFTSLVLEWDSVPSRHRWSCRRRGSR
ncbi:hypothetical protein DL240490_02760 [Mycobacterium marinum]|nr:hypothetical protein DL240490_02760 [Mycobacterium marinum]